MNDLTLVILFILGFILLLTGVCYGALQIDRVVCLNSYSNFQPQWGFFTSCRIMVNGVLTPVDIVRELK